MQLCEVLLNFWSQSICLLFRSNPRKMRTEDLLLSGMEALCSVDEEKIIHDTHAEAWLVQWRLITSAPSVSARQSVCGRSPAICLQESPCPFVHVSLCISIHIYSICSTTSPNAKQTCACMHLARRLGIPRIASHGARRIRYRFVGSWV